MSMDKRRRHSLEVEDELAELGEDEDAYIEAERERRDERFRRDVDRHIFGRGGKLKLNIAKTRLALRDEQHFNKTMKKMRVMEKPGASVRSRRLDKFYDNSPDHSQRIKSQGMGSQEAVATTEYVSQGTKIRPPKPTQRDFTRIIKAKISIKKAKIRLAIRQNPVVEKILNENYTKINEPEASALIDEDGNILRHKSAFNHYEQTRQNASQLGIKLKRDDDVYDEDVHEFLRKTGTIRLQHFPMSQAVSLHIVNRMTPAQLRTVKDVTGGNTEVSYYVGPNYDTAALGKGLRNLLRDHANLFGQKQAQEDDNVNMTYTKSKKVKLLKEMFRDQRTAKAADSIALFKQQKLGPEHEEGFGFDPRHNDFVTPQTARERYGKPGVALHFIATTDNPGPVENISSALDAIGDNHFIGGWKSSTGFKTDASYIINTNDQQEVISHLKRHNQEASYSVDPSGNPYFIRNPDFVKH